MIDFADAAPQVFLAYGAGCVTADAFAMRTAVQNAKDQLKREREMFMERLTKQEQRFYEQIEIYKEQLRICQEGHK